MRFTSTKAMAASICTVALLSAVGCSSDDGTDNASSGTKNENTSPAETPAESPATSAEESPDMAAQLVGPGCEAYAEAVPDGPGSVSGMAEDPVATAASNNPLLKTLVASVSGQLNKKVNLVDDLNGSELTVFAPVDDAFAKLPPATVKALSKPAGAETLSKILTYHVVPGQIAPDKIAGPHKTLEGEELTVEGSGDNLTVEGAQVICGGVTTANATVYLIDTVMSPPSMQ
ncbi:MAG: fasciclin domain-containing protein [Propionibacteriales bacterium]|nr:fasciclin domain-containing protein [Propionibacteriales bacterium]